MSKVVRRGRGRVRRRRRRGVDGVGELMGGGGHPGPPGVEPPAWRPAYMAAAPAAADRPVTTNRTTISHLPTQASLAFSAPGGGGSNEVRPPPSRSFLRGRLPLFAYSANYHTDFCVRKSQNI